MVNWYDNIVTTLSNNLKSTFIKKAQGSANANKNIVTDSSGNITTETKITKTSQLTNDSNFTTATGHNHDGTYLKTGTGTVTSTNIADTTITGGKLVSGTITGTQLADAVKKDTFHDATMIGETAFDLDSLKTASSQGKYYCPYNNISNLTGDVPWTTQHHMLLLVYNNDATKTVQIAYKMSVNETHNVVFFRVYNEGWSSWQQIARISDIPTQVSELTNDSNFTTATGHTHNSLERLGVIGANDDLDNYWDTQGYYTCSSTNASTLANKPFTANLNFILEVMMWGNQKIQILKTISSDNNYVDIYIKTRTSVGISDWHRIVRESDLSNYIQNATGTVTSTNIANKTIVNDDIADATIETGKIKDSAITSAKIADKTIVNGDIADATIEGNKTKIIAIPGTADIDSDTYKQTGIYSCSKTNSGTISGTKPFTGNFAFILEVVPFENHTGTNVQQILKRVTTTQTNNDIYHRIHTGSAWREWNKIPLMSDIPTKVSDLTNDSNFTTATGHTHTKSQITDFPTSMTPTSHASTATTYGVGTTANYGHVKTINGLTQTSHLGGTALSAYQGKVLNDKINNISYCIKVNSSTNPFSISVTAGGSFLISVTDASGNNASGHVYVEMNGVLYDKTLSSGSIEQTISTGYAKGTYITGAYYVNSNGEFLASAKFKVTVT